MVNAIAVITPPNTKEDMKIYNSVNFHKKMGYKQVGLIKNCGYKFDCWFDTMTMCKVIGKPCKNIQQIKPFDEVRTKFGL